MTGSRALVVVVLLAGSLAACTKTESASSSSGAPSASTSATPTPATASAAPSASEAPPASVTAADTAAPPTSASGATTAAAKKDAAAPTAGSAAAAECGTKPQPDCPLQAWMKANANPPMLANDLPGLATALDKIAGLAPPGYTNWASIAKDGAKAARASDMTATKASCRTCHDQYKDKYKKEMRARKI
jgi:hypothetical protein